MPRRRLTPEQAALTGADRKNPQRFRDRMSLPKSPLEIGDPPDDMTPAAKACWLELVASAIPGVLTGSDRQMFEVACNLLAEYRIRPADFSAAKVGRLVNCLSLFGLSPVDRQRLGAPAKPPEINPFLLLDS